MEKERLIGELDQRLNVLGRIKNFNSWRQEIDKAYERKVESASSYEEFMAPYKADLIRLDEKMYAYQIEAYLNWFKQIASDMDEKEKLLGQKMNERRDLLEKICPVTQYQWSTHGPTH